MPIYEFECSACGSVFDRLQKLSDPDPQQCPQCAETSIKRRLTAPAFRLAGSGWYETDFKKEGDTRRNLADKEEAPAPKAEANEAPKSDLKDAPKSEVKETPKSDAKGARTEPSTPAPATAKVKPKEKASDA